MSDKPSVIFDTPIIGSSEIEKEILGDRYEIVEPKETLVGDEKIIEFAREGSALVHYSASEIGSKVINAIPGLRIISCASVGFNTVDIEAATKRGIPVTNVPDFCTEEVADHATALILALKRQILFFDRQLRRGEWDEALHRVIPIHAARNQTVGLVSFGRISRKVAERVKAFGFRVITYDPYVPQDVVESFGVEKVGSLRELMERSDVVSVHVPLSSKTTRLIGAEELGAMKPTAFFVNTGRGATVDQGALYEALSRHRIAGAALDVFENEPIDLKDPLFALENVVATPHVAAYSEEAVLRLKASAVKNVVDALAGRRPTSVINPEVYDSKSL